jgi:hypothetical protein
MWWSRGLPSMADAGQTFPLAAQAAVPSASRWPAPVSADQVPLHEWQRQLLEERLAAHRAADSNEARPWGEVLDRLEERLRASSR